MRRMTRRVWLVVALAALLLAAYLGYDWTRPCEGGPVKQFVNGLLNGGSFMVRCAG